jgi:hypothetical protein
MQVFSIGFGGFVKEDDVSKGSFRGPGPGVFALLYAQGVHAKAS